MKVFMESVLTRLQETFNPRDMGEQLANGMANLVVGLAVFLAFYILWRILMVVMRRTLRKSTLDETTYSFVETAVKYTVLIIGLVSALDAVGINTGALLASLGIVGVTIGFAARDSLSNFISGIIIFIDRPFVLGDLVEIDDKYGRVSEITLRSTRVVTSDGRMLAVPNTEIVNKTVASYTNFPSLRLDIAVTIAVDEDIEKARRTLLMLVDDNPEYLNDPAPRVIVKALNDYNVALELQAWLKDERQHVEKRFELREKVFKALNKAGVEMPFETIQLAPMQVNMAG
ncbi:MAG: mechanosensitive ion channel protein MscS [Anaerolineales bacterium]|nr:mechanosensitive ion channel family protein [Anaerolineae bacterium]PWB70995.1 MAG: mechanosensitive ion channel protein MscS [Anaerolineales bacterium]